MPRRLSPLNPADCEREPGGGVIGGRQRRRDGGAAVRARARPARQPLGHPAPAQRIVLGASDAALLPLRLLAAHAPEDELALDEAQQVLPDSASPFMVRAWMVSQTSSRDAGLARAGGGVTAFSADRYGQQRRRQHAGRGDARGTGVAPPCRRVCRMDGHLSWHGFQAADVSRCSLSLISSRLSMNTRSGF